MGLPISYFLTLPKNTKIALVTGGSSEFGSRIAEKLVALNFYVVVQYCNNKPVLTATHAEKIALVKADFSSQSQLSRFAQKLGANLPHLDIVINCAALHDKHFPDSLESYPAFQKISMVNTYSPVFLIEKLHTKMRNRENALIILISSYYAYKRGALSNIFYSASKTSLLSLSRIFAIEYAPIRSNVIIPGFVDTKTYRLGRDKQRIATEEKSSLNQCLTPIQNIVQTVEFMIQNQSLTATEIKVDGGLNI